MSANASTPSAYNLLELYRQHRDEVDVLTDQTALFILAFTNEMKGVDVDSLAGELSLSLTALRSKLAPLLRGQFMLDNKGILTVTALGRRVLIELGFIPPIPPGPAEPPKKPEPPQPPHKSKLVRREIQETPVRSGPAAAPSWVWGIIAFPAIALIVVGIVVISILPQPTPAPTVASEIQIDFTADRTTLFEGECTVLRWQVRNASWVQVNSAPVEPIGQTQVCPKESTTHSLIAGGGLGARRDVTVYVQARMAPDTPQPTSTPTATPTPTPTRTLTPTPPPGEVKGYVIRAYDQKSIPGARVQISPGSSVVSLDGSYGFSGLAPGDYFVSASAAGYYDQQKTITIASGQTATLNFQLTKQAIASDNNVSLAVYWCFDFASRQSVPPPKGPGCQQPADFQWVPDIYGSPEIRNVGDTRVSVANPQSNAYEACIDIPNSSVTDLHQGEFVCVLTRANQIAVIRLVKFDKNLLTPLTFDWVLYSNP